MDVALLFWGAVVRMAQALLAAAPTLLVGWLIAAILERIVGRAGTYQLFGGNTWRQLPQAWLLGMLLPVCSLGVIPILVQMRRSGVAGGTLLAFGLTAPLFNPISVMYGLTLSEPTAIFVFCMGSLTIISVMGWLWDRLFPNDTSALEPLPTTPYGWRRVAAVALSTCQQAWSGSTLYVAAALVGVGLLSAALPAGCLQRAAGQDDWLAPITMAGVSTLAYVTPMMAIVQITSMFQHGNSIAASFTLLALGAGVNLGLLLWILRNYRADRALIWLGCLLGLVLAISYGLDRPLRPSGVEQADHTHAFDMYCNPFPEGSTELRQSSQRLLSESWRAEEAIAGIGCLLCLAFGGAMRGIDPAGRAMQRLIAPPAAPSGPHGKLRDIVLPHSVIAGAALAGLVAASLVACFLYYPPIDQVRREMNAIEAELVGAYHTGDWEKLEYWIPIQEDWGNKMAVSGYLRGRPLDRYEKLKLQVYMKKLELLEHAAEDQDREEAKDFGSQTANAFRRLKEALASRPKESSITKSITNP